MQAYDQVGFLTMVSKTSDQAFMLLSADGDLLDDCGSRFWKHFSMLPEDIRDEFRQSTATIIAFDSVDEAQRVFLAIQQAVTEIPNIELIAAVFYKGYSLLTLAQDQFVSIAPTETVTTYAM